MQLDNVGYEAGIMQLLGFTHYDTKCTNINI